MRYLIILLLVLTPSCMPLHTNSPLIQDFKKNMEIQAELTKKLSDNVDKISDHLGMGLKSLSPEFKDAISQLRADNDKKYDLLDAKLTEFIKKGAEIAGNSMGIPAPITAGVIGLVSTYGGKMVSDIYANRRRERDAQDQAEELARQKEEHDAEIEALKQKSLIKQRTMAKVNPEYQKEYDRCNAEAINELRARGEIS